MASFASGTSAATSAEFCNMDDELVARRLADAADGCVRALSNVSHFDDPIFGGEHEGWKIAVVSVLCWIITSFAVAAGIGGGGLLMPLYKIGFSLTVQQAVPISKATIFGVAIGNFFFISRERHPKVDRPLIDYSTAVFMQGGELMGVVIGVLFNLLLSELETTILLVVVLGYNAYKTLGKAIVKRKAETAAFAAAAAEAAGSAAAAAEEGAVDVAAVAATQEAVSPPENATPQPDASPSSSRAGEEAPTPPPSPPPSPPEPAAAAAAPAAAGEVELTVQKDGSAGGEVDKNALAKRLLSENAAAFPGWAWWLLFLMCSFFVVYSLGMAKVFDPTFTNCVPTYWPAYVSPFLFYGIIMLYMARRNIARNELYVAAGLEYAKGDIRWTRRNAMIMVPAAIGAGIAAGLLGIGGGMILGPLFVALDFQPQVGTATTGFMILFTAFGGTVKYLTVGKLPWQFALWFGCIGAMGGQTGQRVVKKLLIKTGRPSYVVFILGSIIGLAVCVMAATGISNVVADVNCGHDPWKVNVEQFVCKAP